MAILSRRNYSQMCVVAKGQDGNGLQLENFWQIFFKFLLVSQIKSVKTDFGWFLSSSNLHSPDFVCLVV